MSTKLTYMIAIISNLNGGYNTCSDFVMAWLKLLKTWRKFVLVSMSNINKLMSNINLFFISWNCDKGGWAVFFLYPNGFSNVAFEAFYLAHSDFMKLKCENIRLIEEWLLKWNIKQAILLVQAIYITNRLTSYGKIANRVGKFKVACRWSVWSQWKTNMSSKKGEGSVKHIEEWPMSYKHIYFLCQKIKGSQIVNTILYT